MATATIQHATITDPDIHEPKGAATAAAGLVYEADGLGSGTWTYPKLEGTGAALVNQVYTSDGAGGGSWADQVPVGAGTATVNQVFVSDGAGSGTWEDVVPVGADTATAGQVFVSDGAGSGTWVDTPVAGTVSKGTYLYDDTATATTPIALTVAGTQYELTNNKLGAETVAYPVGNLTDIWNSTTNRIEWGNGGELVPGDTVDLRLDLSVTTGSPNTAIKIVLEGGPGFSIVLGIVPELNFKTAGTYNVVRWMGFIMRNQAAIDSPARLLISADTTGASVVVKEFYFKVLHTN